MLDPFARSIVDPPLDRAARWLAARGVGANAVTFAGFGIGIAAAIALALRVDMAALVLILANRLFDGLDGAVARRRGPTDLGGYYDIVLDFLFYSGIVLAFAVGRPDHALAAAFLIFSFVGTGTSFLAFAIMAAKRGVSTARGGPKALYYVGGLTEGTETIIVLCLFCLLPDAFAWIACLFGGLCLVTTATRIWQARRTFG